MKKKTATAVVAKTMTTKKHGMNRKQLFKAAVERGWNEESLDRAFAAANAMASASGIDKEVPHDVFFDAVLLGEFDGFLFKHKQSRS